MSNTESIGQIALKLSYITAEQLEEAIAEQIRLKFKKSLGQIMLERGILTKEQLATIVAIQEGKIKELPELQKKRREAELFLQHAVREGVLTTDQAKKALEIFDSMGGDPKPIVDILLQNKFITPEQLKKLEKTGSAQILQCTRCMTKYKVVSTGTGKPTLCPKCKVILTPPQKPTTTLPKAELQTMIFKAVKTQTKKPEQPKKPAQKPVDLECIICGGKFQAVPEFDGRVTCPHCGSAFNTR